jgi:hypothetical protein
MKVGWGQAPKPILAAAWAMNSTERAMIDFICLGGDPDYLFNYNFSIIHNNYF